jgi:hypothetical protein
MTSKTKIVKPAAPEAPAAMSAAPETPATTPVRVLGKYEGRETKALAEDPNANVDPKWEGRNLRFVCGPNAPKSPNSRMGVLYGFVKEAGPEGINGAVLATKMRHFDWNDSRSKYNLGLPPIGWAEDYVRGAASPRIKHLKVLEVKSDKASK